VPALSYKHHDPRLGTTMTDPLHFDLTAYEDKSLTLGGRTIAYRAWRASPTAPTRSTPSRP